MNSWHCVTPWSLTQEAAGLNNPFDKHFVAKFAEFCEKHLGKTPLSEMKLNVSYQSPNTGDPTVTCYSSCELLSASHREFLCLPLARMSRGTGFSLPLT